MAGLRSRIRHGSHRGDRDPRRPQRRHSSVAGLPLPLADHDEILLLADGPSGSPAATSIYVWRPRAGEIEVLPQEWFTAEEFDLGYDWITHAVRDPRTGRLAGDGIRISPFVLADGGRTLAK